MSPRPHEAVEPSRRAARCCLRRHAVDTRPLAIPAYKRLLIGQGTSFIGSMLTQVAVPVQVYALSRSSLMVGLVGMAGLIPIVVFGLYGGAIADAIDRRVLYFWSSLGTWAVTLALLAQTLAGARSVALILGLVVVQSAFFAIASSARGAIIPRIVDTDLVPAANTLNFTVGNVGQVVGPLIAGVLVALPHGFAYAYGIDGAAVHRGAVLGAAPAVDPARRHRPAARAALGRRRAGLHRHPSGAGHVLRRRHRARWCWPCRARCSRPWPTSASAATSARCTPPSRSARCVAGLSSGWIGRVRRQGRALTFAIIGWGGAVALAGLAHSLWLAVLLLAVAGAADLVSAVYRQTILQTYAPDEMRGRMQGVFIAVVAGGPRLGDLRAGATAAATGPTFSWVAGGIACMAVVAVAGVFVRPFWRYDASATH